MIDPNTQLRVHWLIRSAAVALMLSAIVWSMLPLGQEPFNFEQRDYSETPESEHEPHRTKTMVAASNFDRVLWHVPPTPAKPEPAKAQQPTRVNLELLAITSKTGDHGEAVPCVVLYDTQGDTIHSVTMGQTISGYRVTQIEQNSVSLVSGNTTTQLVLDAESRR